MEDQRNTTFLPGMLPQPRQARTLSEGQAIANARLQSIPNVSGVELSSVVSYDEYMAPDLEYLFSQLPTWEGDGSPPSLSEPDDHPRPSGSPEQMEQSSTSSTTHSKGVRFTQPMSIEHFPRRSSGASRPEHDSEFLEHRHRVRE